MTDTLKEHRLEAIRSLRTEYDKYGDTECVLLCDQALAGDEAAYNEMLAVVTDTTMGGPSEEEHAEFLAECARQDQ
jgi:hypothetical protein